MERHSARRTAGLALLGALGAAGCPAEPPTVQLVIRADPGVAEQLEQVRVQVTGSLTTGDGLLVCIPCERTFPQVEGVVPMPIVIDYVRGDIQYEEAQFIIEYVATDLEVRKLYHTMSWPESGVLSHEVLLKESCLDLDCPSGPDVRCEGGACFGVDCPLACHCIDDNCTEPEFPVEVLTEGWRAPGSVPCSASCLAEMDADADADGTGDGDGRTDGDSRDAFDVLDDGPATEDEGLSVDGAG